MKILVVGGGSIGERHVRCFQKAGAESVAICDVSEAIRERLVSEYQLPQSFASHEDALTQRFDAVVICTPAHLHVPMAMQALQSGAAVLIEKPLSTAVDGVDELTAVAEKSELPVGVAYVYRHHPVLKAMREAIQQGRFGPPVQAVVNSGQHFPFYRPAYRDIYYAQHRFGGGAIQDALTHLMNAVEWMVGPVERLIADAEHCVLEGVDVEDTVHVIARHQSVDGQPGVMGAFTLNQHQYANESTITISCQNGVARFEGHRNRWLFCEKPGEPWEVGQSCSLERDDMFVAQAKDFLNVAQQPQESPACPLNEAAQTMRVSLAALESTQSKQWVRLGGAP